MGIKAIDDLIAAAGPDRKTVTVTLGETSVELLVKRLPFKTANALFAQSLSYQTLVDEDGNKTKAWAVDPTKSGDQQVAQIARCLINEDGSQAYPKDVVESWPSEVVIAIIKAINAVNAPSKDNVETAEGNSEATRSSDSAMP